MTLKNLLSILIIHRSNFEILHWKSKGCDFDTIHNSVTAGYYEKLSNSVDEIAEMGLRLGINPVNYLDAYREAKKINPDIIILDTSKDYNRDEVIDTTEAIFKEILTSISSVIFTDEMQNTKSNVGIKSALESMFNEYDKEYRFLNNRRKDG